MIHTNTAKWNIQQRKLISFIFNNIFSNYNFYHYLFRNNETLVHLLKGSLGTGILAMPNAFHHAGWLGGTVGTVLIGILCTYCIHLLVKAEYELCKRRKTPSLNYPAVTEAALLEGPDALKPIAPYIM